MADGPPQRRGAFILFEGIDRSGKTTQCSKLVQHLNNVQTASEMWRFPDRTTALGQMINGYLASNVDLDDAAVHLMFAANRWEKSKLMLETLERGTTLVVDRYSYSGMAYTMAKQLPGLDLAWCRAPEAGLPCPDIIFYMRTTPDTSTSRGGFGEERYEKEEFQRTVASNFDTLSKEDPSCEWVVVDASQSIDDIHKQVVASVAKMFESRRLDGPVQKMYTPSPATRNADAAGLLQVNVADAARKAASVQQFPEQGARETRS